MFGKFIENVRNTAPLIHNITNYVTSNDVANIILACGGSPIMADEPEEAAEITSICSGLNINIGMLNSRKIEAMFLSGRKAAELRCPILLDPVGVGASSLRINTVLRLIKELPITVIRGNISEIRSLALGSGSSRGVDANFEDTVTEENLESAVRFVKVFAAKCGSVIAVTGKIDLVSDGIACYVIRNGRPEMGRITGTGCQLSGMMTAFVSANPGHETEACAAAVCAMGLAGEIGFRHMQPGDGNAAYRSRIIDAVYNMSGKILDEGENYEVR